MINYKIEYLISTWVALLCFLSCIFKVDIQEDFIGSYEDPISGEVVLKVHRRDSIITVFTPVANYDGEGKFNGNIERRITFINLEDKEIYKQCQSIAEVIQRGMGGSDWKSNYYGGVLFDQGGSFYFLLKIKKGYTNDLHTYNTNYVLIGGTECLNNRLNRLNLVKR